jgi:hypothetical protein
MTRAREQLDRLLAFDSCLSISFGLLSLIAPHGALQKLGGGFYNHEVHELLRCVKISGIQNYFHQKTNLLYFVISLTSVYGCLRIALGWIIWHLRQVDDGDFRRTVCEALSCCYLLQACAVIRAQLTDRHTWPNWLAIAILFLMATMYASFRFGKGGNMIKIYELPSSATKVS